jgi:hypothetical protein
MKILRHLILSILFFLSIPSYAQNQVDNDYKQEIKTIEDLTIKSIKLRQQINPESEQGDLNNEINILDSTLLNKVTLFLNEYGWQSKKEIGELANMGLFLAIQHSSKEEMESFREIVENAYQDNKIEKSSYALFIDRLKIRNDLPQIYGTQYYYDETLGSLKFHEIEDLENVNKRRREVGLPKIEKNAKQNNITLGQ